MKEECTIERVREMLMEMVKDRECPLCGRLIYNAGRWKYEAEGFICKHLPFIEDDGNAITAGIICGNKDLRKLTLLRCVKGSGKVSDKTEIY